MTGYTVHTGASKKFVSGWDRIFTDSEEGDGKAKKKKKPAKAAKKTAKAASKPKAKKKSKK